MGLKETILGLFQRPPTFEMIMETTEEIKGLIDVEFHIRELNGDKDAKEVKELIQGNQIGIAVLANKEAQKHGSFFVLDGTIGSKVGIILLCSSVLAHNSESVGERMRALNKSITEMGKIARKMREDGIVLNTEQEAINDLLVQRGLYNPNEEFGIIPKSS